MTPVLSVVIPAYNEERRLPATLETVLAFLRARGESFEVVVVNDGSRDRTSEVARAAGPGVRVIENPGNRGKGYAVRNGMLQATGALRLMCDADLSTPIEEVDLLRKEIGGGVEVAIASRAITGARLEKRQSIFREMSGRLFNWIVQSFLVPGIEDTQCGFKLFTARAAEIAFRDATLDGFAFDVEALLRAHRAGIAIREVPVRWRNDEQTTVSLTRGLLAFVDLIRLRLSL